jgi:uncharacterized protein YdeI (YjbR/CyaY-like superfamily)
MTVVFFVNPSDFRKWLKRNQASSKEVWVGYYKKNSGKPSMTWPESVDEALCYGWIDGLRKSIDKISYKIRFTPRRRLSVWSATNIKRARELIARKRMRPAGLKAFEARRPNKCGIYSYEQRRAELEEPYKSMLRKNKSAWDFFQLQSPWYRKQMGWWVVTARKEETRWRRLQKLTDVSAQRKRL